MFKRVPPAVCKAPHVLSMACVTLACAMWASVGRGQDSRIETVQFNRDIRPILSDVCFQCHGPDAARRKANLRFDVEASVLADRDGRRAVVPGRLADSELYRRITSTDDDERMPLPASGRKLTPSQIDLLGRWIEQGAKWQKHWSLMRPERPALPAVKDTPWAASAIDRFVLARLEAEGLPPAPRADKTTLVRRVTLDLTGLPPTPGEVAAFLADDSPAAYEKLVDRLLASPRYGERMATRWLDAARYADTNGYQSDGERTMWRWRDWVIDAYNQNMPFDQFTIEQIAGDMLPNATLEQRIASGFNRNHRGNAEGGVIPEEYAVEYVVDRVDTTSTVWLGLTLGCARCHEHKFDPVTHKEFYEVFAYFNNVPERGKAVKFGNSPPMIPAPTPLEQQQLAELDRQLAAATARCNELEPELAAAQEAWEKSLDKSQPLDCSTSDGLIVYYALDGDAHDRCAGAPSGQFADGEPAFSAGRLGQAGVFDGRRYVDAGDAAKFGFFDRFSIAAWIYPQGDRGGAVASRMVDSSQAEGYSLVLAAGRLQVNLVKRWLDDALRVETEQSLAPDRWHHVAVTYDGSRVADALRVYVDGKREKFKVLLDDLNQTFKSAEPLRIGAGGGPEGRFHGAIDEARIYDRVLRADEVEQLATTDLVNQIAAMPAGARSRGQASKIRAYFLSRHAPESIRQANEAVAAWQRQRQQLVDRFPTTMVMLEMSPPRETFVLVRGQYDKHGERVAPGVPASLSPLPGGAPNDRLGFARWLVDPANPLTARVAVNRFWQMYFGNGLVKTVEDFGSQGQWPSHPELLDWLATDLVATRWNVKSLQKTIVMSQTYCQSSRVAPALWQRDPENRLLARGPRLRLPAEMVRDQALAASGLLVEKIGGPSVKPYQPAGLWKDLTGGEDYKPDEGESLYRRSIYTYWKRTAAPPAMSTFDAAGRETCIVRETRTNTPLQALTLMNDATYVEASRALAQRIVEGGGPTPRERLTLAFRLVLAREPRNEELDILLAGFERHRAEYGADRQAAIELLGAGESQPNGPIAADELAAYTAIASLLLNLDETITKE